MDHGKQRQRISRRRTSERRAWIRGKLETEGRARYDEIQREFPRTSRNAIAADCAELSRQGLIIIKSRHESDGVGVLVLGKNLVSTVQLRESIESKSKTAIGRFGAGVVWGPQDRESVDQDLAAAATRMDVKRQLTATASTSKYPLAAIKATEITNFLARYWEKSHRSVSLDSGTTTARLGSILAKLPLPDPNNGLSGLDVFTNSSLITDIFRDPRIRVGVAQIGGRLRKDTDAFTGELARRCIDSWNLNLDVALVGTTNIEVRRSFEFGCDSEDEAVTKSLMLSRASLRCVVADSSKFREHAISSSFAFCPINCNSLDMVITDHSVKWPIVELLRRRGVVVLTPAGEHL